jgi:hypothetical protein
MKVQTKEISVAEQLAVKEESSVKKDVAMKEISESKVYYAPTKWLKFFYLPSLSWLSCANVSIEIHQKAPVVDEVKDVVDELKDVVDKVVDPQVNDVVPTVVEEKKEKNRLSLKSDRKNSPIAA